MATGSDLAHLDSCAERFVYGPFSLLNKLDLAIIAALCCCLLMRILGNWFAGMCGLLAVRANWNLQAQVLLVDIKFQKLGSPKSSLPLRLLCVFGFTPRIGGNRYSIMEEKGGRLLKFGRIKFLVPNPPVKSQCPVGYTEDRRGTLVRNSEIKNDGSLF